MKVFFLEIQQIWQTPGSEAARQPEERAGFEGSFRWAGGQASAPPAEIGTHFEAVGGNRHQLWQRASKQRAARQRAARQTAEAEDRGQRTGAGGRIFQNDGCGARASTGESCG